MSGRIGTGTAVASNAGGVLATVDVANSVDQIHELVFTLKVEESADPATGDKKNVVLFSGASAELATLPAGVTFESDYFDSYKDFQNYFSRFSTQAPNLIIQTTDTDNYLSNILIEERIPTGKIEAVTWRMSKYRSATGVGYNEVIKIPLDSTIWPGLRMMISKMKAGSEMTFIFEVQGWNKVQRLSALKNTSL